MMKQQPVSNDPAPRVPPSQERVRRTRPVSLRLGIFAFLFAFHLGALSSKAHAQTVNDGFDPNPSGGDVSATLVQPDGKVIIGGQFTTVKGAPRAGIARVNVDGSNDFNFDPGSGIASVSGGAYVKAIARQNDGRIFIGGSFNSVNGRLRYNLARLFENGTVDNTFNTAAEVNGPVNAIAVQPDGKVVIGGDFTEVFREPRKHIARLNADGSLDASFNPGAFMAHDGVFAIALQADGKVLAGGFDRSNAGSGYVVRINTDGSPDQAFQPVIVSDGLGPSVSALAIQVDGKVLIGGSFYKVGNVDRIGVARVNTDGSLDTTFALVNLDGPGRWVNDLVLQADGRVIIGASFTTVNGSPRAGVARLNPDGTVDGTFASVSTENVFGLSLQSDGGVVAGGAFRTVNGVARSGMARLDAAGNLDANFAATGASPGVGDGIVWAVTPLRQGIAVGGSFTTIAGQGQSYYALLNADGRFLYAPKLNGAVRAVVPQTSIDEGIVLGGEFTNIRDELGLGYSAGRIARYFAGATVDQDFLNNTGTGFNNMVTALAIQPDRKILAAGFFTEFNGVARNGIARLNEAGTLDTTFVGPQLSSGSIYVLALQPDGKMLIGGNFVTANPMRNRIARLNADGSIDTSFDPGTGFNVGGDQVLSIAVRTDGKVLVGGSFSAFSGVAVNNLIQLTAAGARDSAFNAGAGTNGAVRSIVTQADGSILFGGDFTLVNSVARKSLARLDFSGNLDGDYNRLAGPNGIVSALATQADGKVLIGGNFTVFNGNIRNRIARLGARTFGTTGATYYWQPGRYDTGEWSAGWFMSGSAPAFSSVEFSYSTDFVNWLPLGSGTPGFNNWFSNRTAPLPLGQNIWFRAKGRVAGGNLNGSSGVVEQIKLFYEPLPPAVTNDLNADQRSDILFTDGSGAVNALLMNGVTPGSAANILGANSGWVVTHTADFNGDSKVDLLIKNADGRIGVLIMNGSSVVSFNEITAAGSGYTPTLTGDFNGDGKADIVITHADGTAVNLTMNGGIAIRANYILTAGSPWRVTHAADFNGDKQTDLVIRNSDGATVILIMNGGFPASSSLLLGAGSPWTVTKTADLDGDGKADILIRNVDASTAILMMNGATVTQASYLLTAGTSYIVTHTGDFDGDGRADLIIRHIDGSTVILLMNGTMVMQAGYLLTPGGINSVVQVADYNADGKADILLNYADGHTVAVLMDGLAVTAAGQVWGPGGLRAVP